MPITDPMRQFDSRTFRRKIKSGRISEAEYREFLASLPDLADKIKPRDEGGDDDGYEERIASRGRPQETAASEAAPASAPAAPAAPESDDDPFAEAPAAAAPVPSPSAPAAAPSVPVVPPAAGPTKTPSFDLPPLDPPTSPSAPSSGSNDDGE
jgi:hypothetical protein